MKKTFKYIPIILSLVLCFLILFDSSVSAVNYAELYTPNRAIYTSTTICLNSALQSYRDNTGYTGQLYYIASSYVDKYQEDYCRARIYISDSPFELKGVDDSQFFVSSSGDVRQRIVLCSNGTSASFSAYDDGSQVSGTSISISSGEDSRFICSSHTVTDAEGNIYLLGIEDSSVDDSGFTPNNDFGALDAMFEGLDAGVQAETLTDTDSTSNSNVFLRIFQSMTGIQSNIGKLVNSIAFHISEISSNLDSYMNDIVQNGFNGVNGLLEDILAAIKDIAVAALPENLVTMIDQLYESGLDADGNFGVDTMLGYWFVPDPDSMHDMFSEAINSSSEFAEILDFAEWFKQHLVDLEPVAPMFTIQPGEYGFITIKNEIRISFEWFEVWKPYTDPLIAAFLYITYFWHLFMSIPGILNGTAATTYAATHMQEPNVPLVSNWQNGVFRK